MNKLISDNCWFGCDWVIYEVGYLGLRAGQLSPACAVVYLWNTGYLRVTRPRSYPGIQHQTPSESKTPLNNYKKGPQRKAFFSQHEEISDDDEYANAEEQFSTDPEPEEHSPYSVYQSSFHPKIPQKSFISPNTWETLSESTKQMNIKHNKKVKLNNPTPYPSGSKTKPNPTLGKPTPAPQQVHQHSQDEPTEEPPPDTSTQTLVNKCLAESGIDPTDIQNVMPMSYAKRNISSHVLKLM